MLRFVRKKLEGKILVNLYKHFLKLSKNAKTVVKTCANKGVDAEFFVMFVYPARITFQFPTPTMTDKKINAK
jgi:hypothetical protein